MWDEQGLLLLLLLLLSCGSMGCHSQGVAVGERHDVVVDGGGRGDDGVVVATAAERATKLLMKLGQQAVSLSMGSV